jgi:hypothetical protein
MSEGEVEQRYLCLREKFSNGYLCLREKLSNGYLCLREKLSNGYLCLREKFSNGCLCLREKFSNGYLCLRETILRFNILPYVGTVNIKQIYLINHVSDNNTERMIPSMINSPPAEVINP